jgi:hypothetical protein
MSTLEKLLKRLFLVVILATFLTATAIAVYATIYFVGQHPDGSTSWISCGSSAGPSYWTCPPRGGICSEVPEMQGAAETFCSLPGDPGAGGGGGGHGPIIP